MIPHTPTPWRAIRWSSHALTTIAADTDPAEPLEHYGQKVVQYGLTEIADCRGSLREGGNEANAARIVACVNYCAGIPNEQLIGLALEQTQRAQELERDAARYRWLRTQAWFSSPLCVVREPKSSVKPGRDCPSGERLDQAIDEARAGDSK